MPGAFVLGDFNTHSPVTSTPARPPCSG